MARGRGRIKPPRVTPPQPVSTGGNVRGGHVPPPAIRPPPVFGGGGGIATNVNGGFGASLNDSNLVGSYNIIHNADGTVDFSGGGGGSGDPLAGRTDAINIIKDMTGGTSDLGGVSVDTIVQGAKRTRKTSQQRSL